MILTARNSASTVSKSSSTRWRLEIGRIDMTEIKYTEWGRNGLFSHGTMTLREMDRSLKEYGEYASKVLRKEDADHVLYGIKMYKDDKLSEIRFYMMPMTEKQFDKLVVPTRNAVVYAIHNHR